MLVTSSSVSSGLDTKYGDVYIRKHRVIIRFLHLRGMKPIEIHQKLSETCNDGVMDVKKCAFVGRTVQRRPSVV